MIRVLRIINRFNLGGPTYNTAYLTKYLPGEFETKLVGGLHTRGEESSLFICENLGIQPQIIPEMSRSVNPVNDVKAYRSIKKIISEYKPHIVHTHASKAGALGRRAAFKMGVPVVVHTFHGHVFHSYFGSVKTGLYKRIEKNLAKKTDAIVAISDVQRNELVNIHRVAPAERTHVINLGFDLQRFAKNVEENRKKFRQRYGIEENEIVVGIIGRLVPVKNHSLFIRAIAPLAKEFGSTLRIVITGDGTEKDSILSTIRQCGLTADYNPAGKTRAQFILTSWMKEAELVHAGSDIICLSSFNEGTPVSLIEAQAAGRAVISTNIGGVEDVVQKDITGFLVDLNDEAGYTRYLKELITNENLRKSMGARGPQWVLNRFDFKVLVDNTASLYHKLLINKGIDFSRIE